MKTLFKKRSNTDIISKSKVGKERKSISEAKQKCGLCVREQTGNTFLPFKHIHTHTLSGISCCGLIAWYIFLLFPSSPVRTELHQAVHNHAFHPFSVQSSVMSTLLVISSDQKRYRQVIYLMKNTWFNSSVRNRRRAGNQWRVWKICQN